MQDTNRRIETPVKQNATQPSKTFRSSIVPKSFMLGGLRINVNFDDNMVNNRKIIGEARYAEQAVWLDPYAAPQQIVEQSYLHELTHWIFYIMNEDELRNNEKLVDLFAHLLYQALTSAEPLPEPSTESPEGE